MSGELNSWPLSEAAQARWDEARSQPVGHVALSTEWADYRENKCIAEQQNDQTDSFTVAHNHVANRAWFE